jgi:hypothetical protein
VANFGGDVLSLITISICVCLTAFILLVSLLRRDRMSLGLPIAYLSSLLLNHVPGAFAHVASPGLVYNRGTQLIELGISFTAISSVCFVAGVWFSRLLNRTSPNYNYADRYQFWRFCVIGGFVVTYGVAGLAHAIPSIGAAIDKGGAIWMLGVMLGMRSAVQRGDSKSVARWLSILIVYPVSMLLFGGFLSYGCEAAIIVLSGLVVVARSYWRVVAGISVTVFIGLTIFVNYFIHRDNIRSVIWSEAPTLEQRIDVVTDAFSDFKLFDPTDVGHLIALDERLNQNYFVGLAAARIEQGQVNYLYGRSLWEALLSLVPRVFWPEKPVFAGSPKIVSEMTGLVFAANTSFGVGNVMEFHINFGVPGLVAGFFLLGWLIGAFDRKAAAAEACGDLGKVIGLFLVGAALNQPGGSVVEMFSGAAAALVAGWGWKLAWRYWVGRHAYATRVTKEARSQP